MTKKSILDELIQEALKEAEIGVGENNTMFDLSVEVSNTQSETKLGIRIKLKPKEGSLDNETIEKLTTAVNKKLNQALEQFDMQVSIDTDVQDAPIGFFIPLSQIKNMIVTAIKGKSSTPPLDKVDVPKSSIKPTPKDIDAPPDDKALDKEPLSEAMRQRTLNEISSIVLREDYYGFVNNGNNIMRSLEGKFDMRESKKYLEYLVKNNIM